MKLVPYTPDRFPLVADVAARARAARSLAHRGFVEHYYGSRDWCRLHLALGRDGAVAGAIGVEQVPFEYRGTRIAIGCASNFVALQPGAGGPLFLHWVRSSAIAGIFGGSPDTHRIVRSQKWTFFDGVRVWRLNRRRPPRRGEPGWRRLAKRVLDRIAPRRSLDRAARAAAQGAALEVAEVPALTADLLPTESPFTLRLAPDLDYLRWRYDPTLAFVRYRLFALRRSGRPCGYVIVNEDPERLMVAQSDGPDPQALAIGILQALAAVAAGRRLEVTLACAHPAMQAVFRRAGFRPDREARPFALGRGREPMTITADTRAWLVNLDWIDNGLRAPFLDERGVGAPSLGSDGGNRNLA